MELCGFQKFRRRLIHNFLFREHQTIARPSFFFDFFLQVCSAVVGWYATKIKMQLNMWIASSFICASRLRDVALHHELELHHFPFMIAACACIACSRIYRMPHCRSQIPIIAGAAAERKRMRSTKKDRKMVCVNWSDAFIWSPRTLREKQASSLFTAPLRAVVRACECAFMKMTNTGKTGNEICVYARARARRQPATSTSMNAP